MARAGRDVPRQIFKKSDSLDRYSCIKCESLLQDPVQLGCGHRVCKHCADELIDNTETTPLCPECGEEITEEDGAKVSELQYLILYGGYAINGSLNNLSLKPSSV